MKSIWTVLVALIFAFCAIGIQGMGASADAKNQGPENVLASYGLAGAENTIRFLKKLKPGENPLPGTYILKARMELKTRKQSEIYESRELQWSKPESASPSSSASGWSVLGNRYLWNPGSDQTLIPFSLTPKRSGGPSIAGINELHIDYEDLYPGAPSQLSVEIAVSGKKLDETITLAGVTSGKKQLSTFESVNVSSAPWKKKDVDYLIRRKMNLPFKPIWNYKQKGGHTFFQRRFHKDLTQMEAMDLVFRQGASEDHVRELICNLRLGLGSEATQKRVVVDWASLPKHTMEAQGRKVIRIEIGQWVRKKFPKEEEVFLEEAIFALPGNPAHILRENLLQTIEFKSGSSLQTKRANILEAVRDHLEAAGTLEFTQELLRGKSAISSVRELLGASPEPYWNYTRKGKYVVLQRSLHKEISSTEALDLLFAPWVDAASVDVKLKLKFEGLWEFSKTFSRNNFLMGIYRIRGNRVLRLGLGDFLRKRYSKKIKKKIYLEGVEIKLPGEIDQIVQDGIFKRIVFQSLAGIEQDRSKNTGESKKRIDRVISLPWESHRLPNKQNQLVIKIGDLIDIAGGNARIQNIILRVQPENAGYIGGSRLLGARMVSLGEGQQPVFFSEGEQLSRKWGGPFLDLDAQEGQTEWVKTLGYLTLQGNKTPEGFLPAPQEKPRVTSPFQSNQETPNHAKARVPSRPKPSQLRIRGITLHSAIPFRDWGLEPDGLHLEGTSPWIEVNWPVHGNISRNTRFFLNIAEGTNNIKYLRVIPFSGGNPAAGSLVLPNKAVSLGKASGPIDKIKIQIHFKTKSFRVKIKEIALFDPVALSPDQAVEFPRLVWKEAPLIPDNIQSSGNSHITRKPGRLTAKISLQPGETPRLSWTTSVERKLSWIQGLNITYRSPLRIDFNNSCWLKLTLRGAQNSINRVICPAKMAGKIYIPAGQLFEGEIMKTDEVIKSISWQILFDKPVKLKQLPITLELGMSLDGLDYLSLRKELPHYPILEMDGQPLYPATIPTNTLSTGPFELNLDQMPLTPFASSHPGIRFLNHPYLEIISAVLEKREPLSRDDWISLVFRKEPLDSFPWLAKLTKPLLALLGFLIIYWSWHRSWFTFFWKSIKTTSTFLWKKFQIVFYKLSSHPPVNWTILNRIFGLLILGPGIFITSYLGQSNAGQIISRTLMILLTAALWHEWRLWISRPKTSGHHMENGEIGGPGSPHDLRNEAPDPLRKWFFGNADSKNLPPFLFLVAFIALGWFAWTLGSFQDFLLKFPPLLGIIYFFLPWLFQTQMRIWITTAVAFYGLGILALLLKWQGGADLFLSFAPVFVLLAWRSLIRNVKPALETRHPHWASKVYGGAGTPYITGFLLTLVLAALFLVFHLEPVASQIAVAGYYALVVGVILEARAAKKKGNARLETKPVLKTEDEAAGA
ncbi:MAG: hypothetical protein ACE5E9_12845 [Nitrospinaceae bacterium]